MIVVGLDVDKHSLTAVCVDELGRGIGETRGPVNGAVVGWGRSLGEERLWAVEDCRHVARGIEQALLAHGGAVGAGAVEVDGAAAGAWP